MGNTIYKNIEEYRNGNKEIFKELANQLAIELENTSYV